MFLQHKTWATCKGGLGAFMATRLLRAVTAQLMDRLQGQPGREASNHLFQSWAAKGHARGAGAGPQALTVALGTYRPAVTPSGPFLSRPPWSPLHPCSEPEYSFLSTPHTHTQCQAPHLPTL